MMINEFCGAHGFPIIPLTFLYHRITQHTAVDFLFQADIKVGTLSASPDFKGTDGARMCLIAIHSVNSRNKGIYDRAGILFLFRSDQLFS